VAKLAKAQAAEVEKRILDHAKMHIEIYAILTPEQKIKWKTMQFEHMKK
jgi:Spy/CpxP family protein refolding chaperone